MKLQTEFEFTLPRGYVDSKGNLHQKGIMRLATAADEVTPLKDMRVRANQAYLVIILLSRVITKLGALKADPASATDDQCKVSCVDWYGNARPVFMSRNVQVLDAREVGSGHLKLRVDAAGTGLDAIGFGLVDRVDPAALGGARVDVAYQLTVNEWRGRRTPQMKLLDVRPAGGEVETAS